MSGSHGESKIRGIFNVDTNLYIIQFHLLFRALLLSCNSLSLISLFVNCHQHKAGLYLSIKPRLRSEVLLIIHFIRLFPAPHQRIGLHRFDRLFLHPMWLFHRSPASILSPVLRPQRHSLNTPSLATI